MKLFGKERILPPHFFVDCKIDFYFLGNLLTIEVDEEEHTDRHKRREIETQEAIEK